ncbi:GDP-L-fucose synthase [Fasciola gigantica]|uniref:GDP-L-fucose synthase n=1 Tax=Fasciola gigantica TaxID=46835 RepID=A0A504YNS1_FASGI|nr:GDP-L-fucose synthase [Fasciola gigantica]
MRFPYLSVSALFTSAVQMSSDPLNHVILVTGGSGLVGQGIRLALENPEYNLRRENEHWVFASSKDVNLTDAKATQQYFEQIRPTHVIHLAAKVGGLFANMSGNLEFFVKRNQPLVVWGSGAPLRQFIYSVDLGRLIVWALREYSDISPIILSVPEDQEISIRQAAELVALAMGCTQLTVSFLAHNCDCFLIVLLFSLLSGFHFDTSKADGQFRKTANAAKLRSLYPNFIFTPFEKAIQHTCDWFSENYASARK